MNDYWIKHGFAHLSIPIINLKEGVLDLVTKEVTECLGYGLGRQSGSWYDSKPFMLNHFFTFAL